jgi:hypothetical protein
MKSTYTPYIKSPFQIASKKKSVSVPETNPVIQEEIDKHITKHTLTVEFKEDKDTLQVFKNVSNMIAYTCEIKEGEKIIGLGRGMAVVNSMNKYVERSVKTALNSSFVNAVIQSTRIGNMNAFAVQSNAPVVREVESPILITEKQRNYLLELAKKNIEDADELKQWEEQIDSLTREEASQQIADFLRVSDNNF